MNDILKGKWQLQTDNLKGKASEGNNRLGNMCHERSTSFIDNRGNIKDAIHLNETKLQLNKLEAITFDWNICNF